jgi:Helix-turn-helix domain
MSRGELRRVEVLSRVQEGGLKLVNGAELMGVSYRQGKRLWKRYGEEGPEGLQHRSAGRESNRAKPKKFREQVLRLVRKKYGGEPGKRFGPTLAAEHLEADDGLEVNAETLRLWMLAEGLWSRQRSRKQHRQRRARKAHFGELVQLDGSFHAWLEERGPVLCLMNLVDDATSTTLSQLHEQETTWAAADVLRAWVEEHGVPLALYADWKNVYQREPTEAERLAGEVPLTQFGRMCQELGTKTIPANSPQAKGRVERNHGTQQDRLIKKMRLKGIRAMAAANRYLRQEYLPDHNRRFRGEAAEPENYHRKAPGKRELDAIFRLQEKRTISNDWVVRYQGRFLQIERESRYAPAGGKVTVSEGRDGSLKVRYRDREVNCREIAAPLPQPQPVASGPAVEVRKKLHRPASDHPWKAWKPKPSWAAEAEVVGGAVGGSGKSKPQDFPPPPTAHSLSSVPRGQF